MLTAVKKAFDLVLAGEAEPFPTWGGNVRFDFAGFGFLMRKNHTHLGN